MPLSPGTRLGPYEITTPLGAGGMGEVFRAHDTRLDRDVAIKVLPGELAQDRERLARFDREAKLSASLNHPNIAHVYGFESAEMPDGSTVHFLAMELVEGEDLAERLRRGAIPVDESIAIARQIAEGLEEAHEHGIIHRDLKPANVKLTPDGKVKVLDFGLAKAFESESAGAAPNSQLSHSPTISRHMTEAGVIMGTAAYMSPEQARGKPVDKRADIWSFGVVLFEMLAGTRLFSGETVSDTLVALLKEPIPWPDLPKGTPRRVVQLLERCLTRDPRDRLRDMGEARVALGAASSAADIDPGSAAAPVAPTPRGSKVALAAGMAGLAVGALIAFAGLRGGGDLRGGAENGASVSLRRLTELPGAELQPSLSPDGRMVVYASAVSGNLDLYLLRVGGDRSIPLTAGSVADDSQPTFSPDGEQIAFRSERDGGGLFVMGATGESVRRVTNKGFDPAWSPDGKRLVYSTEPVGDPYKRDETSELWIADVLSGESRLLFAGDAVQPVWSHDGERIAFWANAGGQRDLWTISAAGGPPVAVTQDEATDWSPEWSPDGRWLYFSSDRGGSFNIWKVEVDTKTGVTKGAPEAVTSGVRGLAYARFSSDGARMAVMAVDRTYEQTLYDVDPRTNNATAIRTLRNPSAGWCGLSPDGGWLACRTYGVPEDLVLVRADGRELRRLTSDIFKDRTAVWDFAGERLLFYSTRGGTWDAWTIRVDGSDLRRLTSFGVTGGDWSPDGRRIVGDFAISHGPRFHVIDVSGSEPAKDGRTVSIPLPEVQAYSLRPQAWSAAGDRIGVAVGNQAGQMAGLAVVDLRDDSYHPLNVPVHGWWFGGVGGWLPDSRHLIARLAGGVGLIDTSNSQWRIIAPAEPNDVVRISRNGRVLLVEHEVLDADIWLIERP